MRAWKGHGSGSPAWAVQLALLGGIVAALLVSSPTRAHELHASEDRSKPSPIIYPVQSLPLRFSHQLHLGKLSMDCEDCHEGIAASASALDNNLPTEEACRSCHAIDRAVPEPAPEAGKAPAACARCHPSFDAASGVVERVQLPAPRLKFSHKAHIERKARCEQCHGDLVARGVELATRRELPKMATCLGCHDGKEAPRECRTCHISEAGGVLRTEFAGGQRLAPSGGLAGAAHGLDFIQSHRFAAQNDQRFCASCHKKDFCVDCHNGVQKPMQYHVGDYRSLHAADARRSPASCEGCHRAQSFCVGCHSRSGVASDGKGSEFGLHSTGQGTLFHPPGWYDPAGGRGPNHHAFEAQRNLRQCVSCHREAFCQRCHSAEPGGIRANPHPRNWRGSRRCRALLKRAQRMCTRCHVDSSELSCDSFGM